MFSAHGTSNNVVRAPTGKGFVPKVIVTKTICVLIAHAVEELGRKTTNSLCLRSNLETDLWGDVSDSEPSSTNLSTSSSQGTPLVARLLPMCRLFAK